MKMTFDSVCDVVVRWSLYAVLFLTPILFAPLTLYPVNLNKQFLFTTIILVASCAWLAKASRKGRVEYVRSFAGIPVAALVVFVVFSAFFSSARHVSFMGVSGGETDTVLAVTSFALFYFLLSVFLKEKEDFKNAYIALMASGTLAVAAALPAMLSAFTQFFGYPFAVWDFVNTNAVGTTNALSLYAGFIAVLAFGFFKYIATAKYMRAWSGALAVAAFILVLLVGYWAALVALIVAFGGGVLLDMRAGEAKRFRRNTAPLVGVTVVACVLIVSVGFISVPLPRIPAPPEVSPSIGASLRIAQATARDGVRDFLLGSGPSTYAYQYSLHRDAGLNATPFWSVQFTQGFNAVLTSLVAWGVFGTILFLAFLFAGVCIVVRIARNRKIDRIGMVIAPLYVYVMLAPFLYPQNFVLQFLLFTVTGILVAYAAQAKMDRGSIVVRPYVAVCAIGIACVLLYVNGKRFVAAVAFARGTDAAVQTKDIEKALPLLVYGSSLDPLNDTYLQALASAYIARANALAVKAGAAASEDTKKQVGDAVAAAVAAAERSTQANPYDAQNWIGLAQVYDAVAPLNSNAAASAYAVYGKAHSLDPANPVILTYLGNAHRAAAVRMKSDNPAEYAAARAAYEDAIALKQDYAPAYFALIGLFDAQGKSADALARAERLRALMPNETEILFQLGVVHYQAGRMDVAQSVLAQVVAGAPNYANALYFLGLTYEKQGNYSLALAQFERVLALNPQSAEVKDIITRLRAKK